MVPAWRAAAAAAAACAEQVAPCAGEAWELREQKGGMGRMHMVGGDGEVQRVLMAQAPAPWREQRQEARWPRGQQEARGEQRTVAWHQQQRMNQGRGERGCGAWKVVLGLLQSPACPSSPAHSAGPDREK